MEITVHSALVHTREEKKVLLMFSSFQVKSLNPEKKDAHFV